MSELEVGIITVIFAGLLLWQEITYSKITGQMQERIDYLQSELRKAK